LHEQLGQRQDADDPADIGGKDHGREKIQQRLDEQQGRIAGKSFLHGPHDAEAAGAKKPRHHGELIAKGLVRQFSGTAFLAAQQRDRTQGQLHDVAFDAKGLAEKRSEQDGDDDRRQRMPLGHHKDADAQGDAAEDIEDLVPVALG